MWTKYRKSTIGKVNVAFNKFLTLYIVYISFYVIWTDMSENKLFVIVIVVVIYKYSHKMTK